MGVGTGSLSFCYKRFSLAHLLFPVISFRLTCVCASVVLKYQLLLLYLSPYPVFPFVFCFSSASFSSCFFILRFILCIWSLFSFFLFFSLFKRATLFYVAGFFYRSLVLYVAKRNEPSFLFFFLMMLVGWRGLIGNWWGGKMNLSVAVKSLRVSVGC